MPKRDLDRIREIIIEVSETPSKYDDGLVVFGGSMQPGDAYQLYLMLDAGLIKGNAAKEGIFFITNHGADFYDAVRDQNIWEQTKNVAKSAGATTLDTTVEIAKSVAAGAITAALTALKGW